MAARERGIIFGVLVVAAVVAFYLLVLGPKRDKASELGAQVDQLQVSISTAEQQTQYGEQARKEFPRYYGRMVVLGKAVPSQSDTASMLVQLNSIADRTKLDFRAIKLSEGGDAGSGSSASPTSSTPTPPPTSTTPSTGTTGTTPPSDSTSSGSTTAASTTSLVPATEASAAAQPIGAVVGTAGFPTLPYDLTMSGGYFDIGNFIGGVDDLVKPHVTGTGLSPDGRLLTISGFAVNVKSAGPPPTLEASFLVTTYSTGDQGLTLGASPSGPAPTSPGETQVQPASAVVAK